MAEKIELRVKPGKRHYERRGERASRRLIRREAGDTFLGTETMLEHFGDRLERVRGASGPEPDVPESVNATDAAVELAAEHGIDMADVEGTGEDGRILKSDVEAAVEAAGDGE